MGRILIEKKQQRAILVFLCNLVFLIILLFPLIMPICASLGTYGSMFGRLFPENPTFDNYVKIWREIPLSVYILNSFLYSGLSVMVCIVPALFGGYWASRTKSKFKGPFLYVLLLIEMVGVVVILASMLKMALWLHIIDTPVSVVLFTSAILIPFAVLLMSSYFDSVPAELEEAALLDGCTRLDAFFRIILPLAASGLTVTVIFAFISAWQEFLIPLALINSPEKLPAVVGVYWMAGKEHPYWELVMAGSIISIIPILILFLIIQRYIIKGIMAGAIKG